MLIMSSWLRKEFSCPLCVCRTGFGCRMKVTWRRRFFYGVVSVMQKISSVIHAISAHKRKRNQVNLNVLSPFPGCHQAESVGVPLWPRNEG